MLLGVTGIKAERKYVVEIEPRWNKIVTVKNEVENPARLLALLPVNDLGCRFDLQCDSNLNNVSFKYKVASRQPKFFYNPPAFQEIAVWQPIDNQIVNRQSIKSQIVDRQTR